MKTKNYFKCALRERSECDISRLSIKGEHVAVHTHQISPTDTAHLTPESTLRELRPAYYNYIFF